MKSISIVILSLLTLNAVAATSSARSNKFNPSIGLNALTLFKNSKLDTAEDGFSLQEVELQFSADVDAFFRAEATLAIHKEEGEDEYHIAPEEIFVESISLPAFSLKAGKFFLDFGKYNTYHTHTLPFVYKSQLQDAFLGHEGLNDIGVSVSYLTPLSWFSELTLQVTEAGNEDLFAENDHAMSYNLKWKNLWDLSESTTLELGLSGLMADYTEAALSDDETNLYAADLTLKWRPTKKSKTRSFTWSTEYIQRELRGTNEEKNGGLTTLFLYQHNKYLSGFQYEYIGLGRDEGLAVNNVYTGMVGYAASEFSALRLQYDEINAEGDENEKRVSMQFSVSFGAHPAHQY